jgi:hypothetical protein
LIEGVAQGGEMRKALRFPKSSVVRREIILKLTASEYREGGEKQGRRKSKPHIRSYFYQAMTFNQAL